MEIHAIPGEDRQARQAFRTEQKELQLWLLSAALLAHLAEELPFSDLVRLPELFPFSITIGVQDMRESARFEVNRQGMNWDMVPLAGRLQGLKVGPE